MLWNDDVCPCREEGALFGVYLDKLGLQVLLGQDTEVLVDNLGRDRHLAFWVLGGLVAGNNPINLIYIHTLWGVPSFMIFC